MSIALVGEAVRVPLVGGTFYTLVSAEDLEKVLEHRWYAQPGVWTTYAKSHGPGRSTYLHRFVLGANKTNYVDHIDGNGLNNIRSNIRLVNNSTNMHKANFKTGQTGLRGVHKHGDKFVARVTINLKKHYIGIYETAIEAHVAYLAYRRKMGLEDVNSLSR